MEANISDPNLGWIDNTEYDPNNPGTAEILAWPRDTFFDYYGPGYTQPEGIQFCAASFAGPMEDGNLASFIYTATEPGYVILTLVNYDTVPATLEEMIIRQVDPNDPNNIPEEPNEPNEPPAFSAPLAPGVYDEPTHTITWDIGTLQPGDSGTVSFRVSVNEAAEPLGILRNKAVLRDTNGDLVIAIESTDVCCWDSGDIIYVKTDANGLDTGTSWANAYTDLQKAIVRINAGCGSEIWVARGTYKPGTQPTSTFLIPEDVAMYGGFAGRETSIDQRHIKDNPTILSGDTGILDNGVLRRNDTVVTMGNNSLLDGFVVKEASNQGYGILGQNVDFAVFNCSIEDNQKYGVRVENGDVTIKWCIVRNNIIDGIYHFGNNAKTITVENCQISENGQNGTYARLSIPIIRNNQISFNGTDSTGAYYGLYLFYPKTGYAIHNNTVVYNANEGIGAVDPNNLIDIRNCILYGNKQSGDEEQMSGYIVAHYSCVYDPNFPNQTTPDANHNISCYPRFAYDGDPNVVIYHLLPDSSCIDRGDPGLSYADQNDIDNETRFMGTAVEMGADEIDPDCARIYHPLDRNADGIVNYNEFRYFSNAWLTYDPNNPLCDPNNPGYIEDPNDPGYITPSDKERFDPACDLDSDLDVDLGDLLILAEEGNWLWIACWRTDILEMQQQAQQSMMMMSMSSSLTTESTTLQSEPVSEETQSVQAVEPVVVQQVKIIPPVETIQQEVESVEPEISIEQQIADLQEAIQFFETLWDDPQFQQEMQASDWQAFMDELYNSLTELQENDTIIQDMVEE